MKKLFLILVPISLGLVTCNPQFPLGPNAQVDFEPYDEPTTPLSPVARKAMDGVYDVIQGRDLLGQTVVGRWIDQPWALRWSLYASHDVVFAETAGGSTGDHIRLTGYVRKVRSGSSVGIRLEIQRGEGASALDSSVTPNAMVIRGTTDNGIAVELRWSRPITAPSYTILAHQGGGRNSDRMGYSENSIPMIRHAAIFGATGIEIDVRRTRDNEIIVFHDDTFSPRTVQGIYLLGPVEDYDLSQIQSLGKLVNGETIPTLSEALKAVIDETSLTLVWLDVKDPKEVNLVIPVQMEALTYAASVGRDSLRIYMGIPSDEVLNAYRESPYNNKAEVLTELGADVALALPTCRAWAQYWTENLDAQQMVAVRQDSIKIFVWTVDLQEKIVQNLDKVDGILTNYSSLARGIHDSR